MTAFDPNKVQTIAHVVPRPPIAMFVDAGVNARDHYTDAEVSAWEEQEAARRVLFEQREAARAARVTACGARPGGHDWVLDLGLYLDDCDHDEWVHGWVTCAVCLAPAELPAGWSVRLPVDVAADGQVTAR